MIIQIVLCLGPVSGFLDSVLQPFVIQLAFVERNGFVVDMGSCSEFTEDGRDNGLVPANVIEDQFDWHNDFVGQYHGFRYPGFIAFIRKLSRKYQEGINRYALEMATINFDK